MHACRLFFIELSNKGNAIYNILPDIISHISDPEANLARGDFNAIVSFLFDFIKKVSLPVSMCLHSSL